MHSLQDNSGIIACTLTAGELKDVAAAWERLLRESLVSRQEIPGGIRLRVHPGSAEALATLVGIERECCAWISFELDGPEVSMTSPGDGERVIRETWVEPVSGAR